MAEYTHVFLCCYVVWTVQADVAVKYTQYIVL